MSLDLKTALVSFAGVMVAVVALARLGAAVPLVAANLGALVAVVFLYVPVAAGWRRGEDLAAYGFTLAPVGRGLAFALGACGLVFPLFFFGFLAFYQFVCAGSVIEVLALPGLCRAWRGWAGAQTAGLDWTLVELAAVQVVVVALPEELFFRGYLHELCERVWRPRRRFMGGGLGWALVVSSALFAVGHLAVDFDPRRLAVFFPGLLFGWLRSATGSILASTFVHAASNVYIDVLQRIFF
jgi:uncharacterized protein